MKYLIFLSLLTLLVSCERSTDTGVPATKDREVTVSISIPSTPDYAPLPDPGDDHGEWTVGEWEQMAIFFLYSDRNYVSVHTITRDEFYGITTGTGTDTARHISVPILTGTVEEVRVATFAAPQTLTSTYSMTRAEADAFSTVSLIQYFSDSSPSAYLRSLLTGTTGDTYKGGNAIPLLPGQTPTNVPHIHVVLTRLVAKVDLQYDLQAAYEGNTLAKPSMSAITFHGLDRGYFFKTDASAGLTYTETLSSRISELNGRVYFYALPGAKNQLEFTVDYGSDKGKKQWTATFNSALTPASWHKIHLTVSGSQIDGGNTTITLGQSEQSEQP